MPALQSLTLQKGIAELRIVSCADLSEALILFLGMIQNSASLLLSIKFIPQISNAFIFELAVSIGYQINGWMSTQINKLECN
jgi:hypothetical protein